MFGMNRMLNASLLLIQTQELGHIQSMSTTEHGIHKSTKIQTLSFGEAPMPGLALIMLEMETLSSGGIPKVTIKYLPLITHHTPLFMDVILGLVYSIPTKLGFSQGPIH